MSQELPDVGSGRDEFVREMYRVYWANMSRSMDGTWKLLAPVTVGGTIIAGVHKDYLPASMGLALAFLIVFWAMNITIDLNAWHRRNLLFASKAERTFLRESDFGTLLPSGYRTPKLDWITFYRINVMTFVVFLIIAVTYAVHQIVATGLAWEWAVPALVLVLGTIVVALNYRAQEASAARHFRELFDADQP